MLREMEIWIVDVVKDMLENDDLFIENAVKICFLLIKLLYRCNKRRDKLCN